MAYLRFVLVVVVPALILAACSGSGPQTPKSYRTGCEDAVARAAGPGRASATAYAKSVVKFEVQELKGFMLKDGYRSVRPQPPKIDCRPYAFGGLTLCTATVRLCSH